MSASSSLLIRTTLGSITLSLRADAAPVTVEYICNCARAGLYNSTSFYRSDFVIQCGLHGSGKQNPYGALPVNETASGVRVSNLKGTAAIAHFDVPDNGNTEFFINLGANKHLDEVYGGYCVFAEVAASDEASWATVNAIADAIANKGQKLVQIESMEVA